MELIGTNFCLNLGGWRLRLSFAIDDNEEEPAARKARPPHRLRVVPEDEFVR